MHDIVKRAAIFLLRHGRVGNGWNLKTLENADGHTRRYIVQLALVLARQEFATAGAPFGPQKFRQVHAEIVRDIRTGILKA